MENKLTEPKTLQYKLSIPGLQSTHAITFHIDTKIIINHVFPDTITIHGLEITKITSAPYTDRKDSEGNIIPFILPPDAKLKEQIYSTITIEIQEKQRFKWQQEIDNFCIPI